MLEYAASVTFSSAGCVRLEREEPRRSTALCSSVQALWKQSFDVLNFFVGKATTTLSGRGRFLFRYETNKPIRGHKAPLEKLIVPQLVDKANNSLAGQQSIFSAGQKS